MAKSTKGKGPSKARVKDVADAGKPGAPDKKVAGHKKAKGGNSADSRGPTVGGFLSKKSLKMPKGCGK